MQWSVNEFRADTADPADRVLSALVALADAVSLDVAGLPERAAERIHDIRVALKRFRAKLALLAGGIPRGERRRLDRLAKELKDHFSTTRDADVQRDLLFDLLPPDEARRLAGELGLGDAGAAVGETDMEVRERCAELAARAQLLRVSGVGTEIVTAGWRKSRRAERRMMRRCAAGGDDAAFHDWRKRVKALLYQSECLPDFPEACGVVPLAGELAATLGKHHDLAVLTSRFAERLPGHGRARELRKRKKALGRMALEQGRGWLAGRRCRR